MNAEFMNAEFMNAEFMNAAGFEDFEIKVGLHFFSIKK